LPLSRDAPSDLGRKSGRPRPTRGRKSLARSPRAMENVVTIRAALSAPPLARLAELLLSPWRLKHPTGGASPECQRIHSRRVLCQGYRHFRRGLDSLRAMRPRSLTVRSRTLENTVYKFVLFTGEQHHGILDCSYCDTASILFIAQLPIDCDNARAPVLCSL
jgi:hypothetical protein